MKSHYFAVALTTVAGAYTAFQTAIGSYDIWAVLDKYGFPTAMLTVVVLFIWNRQKKADGERNELISQNSELVREVINAVKASNACKFIEAGNACKFVEGLKGK